MGSSVDVAIVGAGPYGLSIAAHLRGRGVGFRIFGQLMDSWARNMPAGMALKSDGFASNLSDPGGRYTLEAYARAHGHPYSDLGWPVPLEVFTDYGRWFQSHAVPELEQTLVRRIERSGGGFVLTLDTGEEVSARRVVLAVGITHFRRIPEELAALPSSLMSHSADHKDPGALSGRDVVVLGAGASALDLAMLMGEAGVRVSVLARTTRLNFNVLGKLPRPLIEQLRWPTSGLGRGWPSFAYSHFPRLFRRLPASTRVGIVGRALGPSAGHTVRDRLEGKAPFLLGRRIAAARPADGKLVLELVDELGGREELRTDHLVAATGYRPDVKRLDFLSEDIIGGLRTIEQSPALSEAFESSVPGLHFVGLSAANTFGPLLRFAYGADFTARHVARRLA